jgi:hypothetical protein
LVLKDRDIRQALHKSEIVRIVEADPTSLVLDELGIFQGKYRIDVAVVNGQLTGFEIKSAADTLERLPKQQKFYSQVFDRITLVADERHVVEAMKIVPPWWGLMVATTRDGEPVVEEIWRSRQNQSVDPFALCQLLWREEALAILRKKKRAADLRSRSRKLMWKRLASELELEELKYLVLNTLKFRTDWR